MARYPNAHATVVKVKIVSANAELRVASEGLKLPNESFTCFQESIYRFYFH
jgi:hypothetical protein